MIRTSKLPGGISCGKVAAAATGAALACALGAPMPAFAADSTSLSVTINGNGGLVASSYNSSTYIDPVNLTIKMGAQLPASGRAPWARLAGYADSTGRVVAHPGATAASAAAAMGWNGLQQYTVTELKQIANEFAYYKTTSQLELAPHYVEFYNYMVNGATKTFTLTHDAAYMAQGDEYGKTEPLRVRIVGLAVDTGRDDGLTMSGQRISLAGITFMAVEPLEQKRRYGGAEAYETDVENRPCWTLSSLYKELNPKSITQESADGQVWSWLPSDLKSNIVSTQKETRDTYYINEYQTATSKMWIPTVNELGVSVTESHNGNLYPGWDPSVYPKATEAMDQIVKQTGTSFYGIPEYDYIWLRSRTYSTGGGVDPLEYLVMDRLTKKYNGEVMKGSMNCKHSAGILLTFSI